MTHYPYHHQCQSRQLTNYAPAHSRSPPQNGRTGHDRTGCPPRSTGLIRPRSTVAEPSNATSIWLPRAPEHLPSQLVALHAAKLARPAGRGDAKAVRAAVPFNSRGALPVCHETDIREMEGHLKSRGDGLYLLVRE